MDDLNNSSHTSIPSRVAIWGRIVLVSLVLFVAAFYTIIWTGWGDDLAPQNANAQNRRRAPAFDLSRLSVPKAEVHAGGPPKDGIPALSNPRYLKVSQAKYLRPDDRVIGVHFGQEARAYPLRILSSHEIVNDKIGATPFAVTYCPLCDSSVVFDRRTPLGLREFGVSGLLYNSNVLMYDRGGDPESLWSQLMATGVSGAGVNKKLKTLPVEVTTWKNWSTQHPQTLVLSNETGHNRNYQSAFYKSYFDSPNLMFPVNRTDDRLVAKTPVLGVWSGDTAKAYPVNAFSSDHRQIREELDGKSFTIEFDPESQSLRVVEADAGVEWMYSFWFAWAAFRPETALFEGKTLK